MWVALIGLACHRHRNKDSMFRVPIVYVHLYIHLFLWNYIYMRNATFNFLSSINFNIIWSNLQHTKCMPYTKNDCIISPSRFQKLLRIHAGSMQSSLCIQSQIMDYWKEWVLSLNSIRYLFWKATQNTTRTYTDVY